MFYIWFGICFLCYFIRTVFNVFIFMKNPLAENKIIIHLIYAVMAILWFSWFQICFVDPVKIDLPEWVRILGLAVFILGVFLFIYSHINLHGFQHKGEFIQRGIYLKIRNPMYLGFILWIIGFPVFMHGLITLISSVIWISFIVYWKILEERDLERQYSEYREYKRKTWF